MKITTRERRDWTLLIFIIPIGIIFMMIAGQIAVRIVPQWSVNAGMQSQLDPATAPKQQVGLVQPVLPEILTPLGWFDTFLTPNADSGEGVVFPPFIVIETATPSPTASPTVSPTVTQTPTATVSPSPTVVTTVPPVISTTRPPDDEKDKTPTPPAPPTTCTDPLASNFNGPLPCTYPPPPVASTIDPSLAEVPPPAEIEVGAPPDGDIGNIIPGTYIVLDISGNPVVVTGSSETNYDLVYYESDVGGNILLDSVILGISQLIDGSTYYEVFNWGDNDRDTNTNVDTNTLPADPACTASPPECDNRDIPTTELHPQPAGGTGILIDVDNASSAPPANTYNYLVIISPNGGDGDAAQVDAVEVTEVPP